MVKKKILIFSNNLGYFFSHREPLIPFLKKLNWEIVLVHGNPGSKKIDNQYVSKIKKYKIKSKQINMDSSFVNIKKELFSIISLYKFIKKTNPTLLHTISPKANLYGGIISLLFKFKLVISVSGLGSLQSSRFKFLYIIYNFLLRVIFLKKNLNVIFHNKSDLNFYKNKFNLNKNQLILTHGSGIDLKNYNYNYNYRNKKILFAGRILKSKGVEDFIIAANILKKKIPDWQFLIAGTTDYNNPDSISISDLKKKIINNKNIKYLGYVKNNVSLYKDVGIYCLPSYSEGLSKTLLEASASGIPVVASNIPGSLFVVRNNKTGILFKKGDILDLAQKIYYLAINKKLRLKFSKNIRKLAVMNFKIENVLEKHKKIYEN
jgi:glycosyltransferase involved in cell wall biosynthesis